VGQKLGGVKLTTKKKMGRPTDSPKRHNVKARIDDETLQILKNYCDKTGKSQAEGVRDGIHCLKDEPKK